MMDRYGFVEHVRQRILNDENKTNTWKSHGVEKVANKARKFRITCHKVPPVRYTFEDNVLRKVQSIRASVAFKQCCRKLKGYEDEDIEIITRPYNSMQSLYTSESVTQVRKTDCDKNMGRFRNRHFSISSCDSRSWADKSFLKSAEKEPGITKANGFLPNNGSNLHLLQSERLYSKDEVNEFKKTKAVQPQIPAIKPNNAFNWSTKSKAVSQHLNLNIDSCGHSNSCSCDEISVKIKQSFSNLNNLESHIDKATRFMQASFSNRLSISSVFECDTMDDASSSKKYALEEHLYNDHLSFEKNTEGVTCGKTSCCRVKAHIAYGRDSVEMNQHLRNVDDAFSSQLSLHKHKVSDGRKKKHMILSHVPSWSKNSASDEKCSDQQSSFYATVQQRMNKALQHNPLSNNMYKSQSPLKERHCDPLNLFISSFSKMDAVQNDDARNEVRSAEFEAPKTTEQQTKISNMRLMETPACSNESDAIESNEINNLPTYSSQELLMREHYADNTVKALRQFYRDSMLYFVELRKLYRQRKIEDLWKVENEEERIKEACLKLKRKYINSVHNTMSLKNLVDYHLHETARIQLLNLDLQKHLTLLRGSKKDSSFEKFRRASEKVLLLTKDFEKNNLANELERWELKLRTRSRGLKNDIVANSDTKNSLFSSPLRVVRKIQEMKMQNLPSYNKNLQQLREELKRKRKEADFLKRTFNQRVMRNDLSEENSLRAQIDAHVRYIMETEKDIAQLIKLQNENSDSNERETVLSIENCENYPASSSRLTSMAEKRFSDGRFSKVDGSRTSFNDDIHSTNKSDGSEQTSEGRNIESCQFSKLTPEKVSGDDPISERHKNLHLSDNTHSTCHSVELPPSTLTPQRFTSLERFTERSVESNHIGENCNASNEMLTVQNKLFRSQDIPTIPNDPTCLIIHSPGSNHSNESVYSGTISFKQDISKEALLISAVYRSDSNSPQVDEQEQSAVQQNDSTGENETAMDGCNLHSSILDEQFFTPLPSDIETDNEEKADDFEERRITSQESSSSFHTTVSSLTPNVQTDSKQILTPSSKSRKFKLTISPLSLPGSPVSARYAASMPHEDSSKSAASSPHTPKTVSNRCISPLSASLLESLLEDSLTTMLALEHSQTLEGETFVRHEESDKLPANSAALSEDNSWQSDQSYDLNRIPVPEDLIPGLDLSGANSTESEVNVDEKDLLPKVEKLNIPIEVTDDKQTKSQESLLSSQFRYYLDDEKWVAVEIHSVSEQIWSLASSKQPLEILVKDDPKEIASQEIQMRQIIADRCCEIAKCCFKNVGNSRYMGLTNINCFRPRNLLHLESILQKKLSKYYETNKQNTKEKKRWELLSRDQNSDIENIVLEELYAEQNSWEDILENYEDEVKAELVSELWHEQLDESLSSVINL